MRSGPLASASLVRPHLSIVIGAGGRTGPQPHTHALTKAHPHPSRRPLRPAVLNVYDEQEVHSGQAACPHAGARLVPARTHSVPKTICSQDSSRYPALAHTRVQSGLSALHIIEPLCTQQAKSQASSFGMLFLCVSSLGAAFLPHMAKPGSVASKLAQASHPVAVSPQWLPVLLAAGAPAAFMSFQQLRTAAEEYNNNPTDIEAVYGPIGDWNVAAIDIMDNLFKDLVNFDANITSWDTSSVTTMVGMFRVRALCAQPPPRALLCTPL